MCLYTFTCGIYMDSIVQLQHVYLHCSCTVVQFGFCSSASLGLKFFLICICMYVLPCLFMLSSMF